MLYTTKRTKSCTSFNPSSESTYCHIVTHRKCNVQKMFQTESRPQINLNNGKYDTQKRGHKKLSYISVYTEL